MANTARPRPPVEITPEPQSPADRPLPLVETYNKAWANPEGVYTCMEEGQKIIDARKDLASARDLKGQAATDFCKYLAGMLGKNPKLNRGEKANLLTANLALTQLTMIQMFGGMEGYAANMNEVHKETLRFPAPGPAPRPPAGRQHARENFRTTIAPRSVPYTVPRR